MYVRALNMGIINIMNIPNEEIKRMVKVWDSRKWVEETESKSMYIP